MSIYNAAWAIPLLPLLGALISFGVETQRRAAQVCVVFAGLSFVVAAVILGVRLTHASAAPFESLLTFFAMTPPEGTVFATQFQVQLGIHVDALAASFAAAIAFATLLVQGYALTAMRGEPGFRRFFWAASVLGATTTAFVLSPNLFESLTMWVGASAALYLLVSLSWERADSALRALRVMVVLTAGDVALTLGVLFAWIKFGVFSSSVAAPTGQTLADPFSFGVITQGVLATLRGTIPGTGPRALLVMGIVFVVAAVLRTAQFPFHGWLRDTASSSIPVLALASATVAPLGVYLLARVYPVIAHSPRLLPMLALVGGVSAILTGAIGATQHNLRRIAVYAVASQLGLALIALGMGGFSAGVFVAFTSIFTAAVLLLAAGNLIRVYRTDDIREMGGAWARMRTTSLALGAWALLASGLALSSYYALAAAFGGLDPAGGGFSTRERVTVAVITILAAAVGALLAGRVLMSVLAGAVPRRRGFQHERVAEAERGLRRLLWPGLIAAIVAVLVGLPGAGVTFARFVFYGNHHQSISFDGAAALVALLALVCGASAAWMLARGVVPAAARAAMAWPVRVLERDLYVERLTTLAARPVLAVAAGVSGFDEQVTSPIATSVGESVELAATGLGAFRNARLARNLAGGLVVIGIVALLTILAATGHLWVHTA